jgi:protein-tyrosine phosphatase
LAPFREPHSLTFDAVANFRDMGGHTTRDGARLGFGRLFRSGHLADASDADVERIGKLEIRRVFDFRNLADIEHEGSDVLPKTTGYTRLPMPDPAKHEDLRSLIERTKPAEMAAVFGDGQAAAAMTQSANDLVSERREVYQQFLSELANADAVPALFHCSAGKDRAGWAGSVVLLTLGVDEEQVIEQYLLSNRAVAEITKRFQSRAVEAFAESRSKSIDSDMAEKLAKGLGELMLPFLEVRREYIDASFAAVKREWGSFDGYLHDGLGITVQQRDRIRELLLE